jgi:two-component system NtrC family response regulator
VSKTQFRDDLFYRLSVITLDLPPLRERGSDILLIALHYLHLYNVEYNKQIIGFTDNTEKEMKKYPWPGNIRELENKIKRAVIMSNDRYIDTKDLQLASFPNGSMVTKGLKHTLDQVEKKAVVNALEKYTGNISKAAEFLDISRATFYDLIKKHQINHHLYKI